MERLYQEDREYRSEIQREHSYLLNNLHNQNLHCWALFLLHIENIDMLLLLNMYQWDMEYMIHSLLNMLKLHRDHMIERWCYILDHTHKPSI